MNGFYLLIAIASSLAIIITIFLGMFFKNHPIVKYIPAIISVLSVLVFLIKSKFFSSGFEDLAYIVLTIIAGIVFLTSFITAIIIGLFQRKKRRTY